MRIRHVSIRRFRGINKLDWSVPGSMICLIGPGDSTKTTILDAIEYALSPRWNIPFTDADFYLCRTDEPVEITVTVGQLPDKLKADSKFGLYLRGWTNTGLRDEPEDDDEHVLSIRLIVDASLEASWSVITDRHSEGKRISYRHREMLAATRLKSYFDRELSWSPGSALSRVTGDLELAGGFLAEAQRRVREIVANPGTLPKLEDAVNDAKEAAAAFGVQPKEKYCPGLDILPTSTGVLALFDGEVPARLAGHGSKRLLTLALQRISCSDGAILLIDEVEHALEPHRLRHLLRQLRPSKRGEGETCPEPPGQTIMTSHSHISVVELMAEDLYVVRSDGGKTVVKPVTTDLQSTVRSTPEALLGRKIIVCEGKTEYGVCRALDRYWQDTNNTHSMAYEGVVVAEGGGSKAAKRALELAKLGYNVILWSESDTPMNPTPEKLIAEGVQVLLWAHDLTIEQRVAADLPWPALQELLNLAAECIESKQSIVDAVSCRLDITGSCTLEEATDQWLSFDFSKDEVRTAIGLTAKEKKWFKRIGWGEQLGTLICKHLPDISGTDLAMKLEQLRSWVYDR